MSEFKVNGVVTPTCECAGKGQLAQVIEVLSHPTDKTFVAYKLRFYTGQSCDRDDCTLPGFLLQKYEVPAETLDKPWFWWEDGEFSYNARFMPSLVTRLCMNYHDAYLFRTTDDQQNAHIRMVEICEAICPEGYLFGERKGEFGLWKVRE